jgi:hypothetical protein
MWYLILSRLLTLATEFTEKLFGKLKKSTHRFEVRLMMMNLISRMIATHRLVSLLLREKLCPSSLLRLETPKSLLDMRAVGELLSVDAEVHAAASSTIEAHTHTHTHTLSLSLSFSCVLIAYSM